MSTRTTRNTRRIFDRTATRRDRRQKNKVIATELIEHRQDVIDGITEADVKAAQARIDAILAGIDPDTQDTISNIDRFNELYAELVDSMVEVEYFALQTVWMRLANDEHHSITLYFDDDFDHMGDVDEFNDFDDPLIYEPANDLFGRPLIRA